MWRALILIAGLSMVAAAAVWLADVPGAMVLTFAGYEVRTSLAVAFLAAFVLALVFLLGWTSLRFLFGIPAALSTASKTRRTVKGFAALSRGMIAIGAGDKTAARRHASEAERLLGHEPLALLLRAQTAQISGEPAQAEATFRRMLEDSETRVLGLRGLFVEARRRGDGEGAFRQAGEALRLAPTLGWANEAVLESLCGGRQWPAAIAALERQARQGLIDQKTVNRHKAVLLTAQAWDAADTDEAKALSLVLDAAKRAPDLIPTATLAGRLLARRGEVRKASKIIETAWKTGPHPDLAVAYLDLRAGDAAKDRLERAVTLARLSSWHPESRLAIAKAALQARAFSKARDALAPLLADRPSVRTCLSMARIEEAEHGSSGRSREWFARAVTAPRDPLWVAEGVASERWAPVSPVTGRIDAYRWQTPPETLSFPATIDDVVADLDETPAAPPPLLLEGEAAIHPEIAISSPDLPEASMTMKISDMKTASDISKPPEALPVVFPLPQAPDDPGVLKKPPFISFP